MQGNAFYAVLRVDPLIARSKSLPVEGHSKIGSTLTNSEQVREQKTSPVFIISLPMNWF